MKATGIYYFLTALFERDAWFPKIFLHQIVKRCLGNKLGTYLMTWKEHANDKEIDEALYPLLVDL